MTSHHRYYAFLASSALAASSGVAIVFGDWRLCAPGTGFMDCGEVTGRLWRSGFLPDWVTLGMMVGVTAVGVLAASACVAAEMRARSPRRRAR
jgi:hypothetical protein